MIQSSVPAAEIALSQEVQLLRWRLADKVRRIRLLQTKLEVAQCSPDLVRARAALLRIERMARAGDWDRRAVMQATAEGIGDKGPVRSRGLRSKKGPVHDE